MVSMSPQQLRTCIKRLDSAPDGWRRCALAFLEAQSWGEDLPEPGRGTPRSKPLRLRASRAPRRNLVLLSFPRGRASSALAAGIALIAFSAGLDGEWPEELAANPRLLPARQPRPAR